MKSAAAIASLSILSMGVATHVQAQVRPTPVPVAQPVPVTQPDAVTPAAEEMVYGTEPEQIAARRPKSRVAENQLLVAGHLTLLGPVGPLALEVGADLANWVSIRAIAGYVPDGNAHFGAAESFLDGFQAGAFATARIPLGNWTIRPGFGFTVGAFDGQMLYDLDDHPWAEPEIGPLFEEENTDCVFGCNEEVKLDGVLWAHLEIGGQYRFHEDFFLRAYAGLSMGVHGWGLQECYDCSEQERDDKSGEIFGHTVDPYGGVALGWAINLAP